MGKTPSKTYSDTVSSTTKPKWSKRAANFGLRRWEATNRLHRLELFYSMSFIYFGAIFIVLPIPYFHLIICPVPITFVHGRINNAQAVFFFIPVNVPILYVWNTQSIQLNVICTVL